LNPPLLEEVSARLKTIDFTATKEVPDELHVFYHPETLREIVALKEYLFSKEARHALDTVDEWIRMVAINRLTGHSAGFFSVYTLPPNQAVSLKSQARINTLRKQVPPRRSVPDLIRKKSKVLLSDCDEATRRQLASVRPSAVLLTSVCSKTPQIRTGSVALIVTSPPFLNVVDYGTDNWLRCWFLGIDAKKVKITMARKLDEWQAAMTQVMKQFRRVLKPGGHLAFEVGEVFGGSTPLEQAVVPCGEAAGLEPLLVTINDQKFTKTANCWGVDNMSKGTNTNRIVLFRKS
jgi:hypothetical protein